MNRLASAPSRYLREHANNPVDWRPLDDEAFEEARARDVPVFLSIGYAACHWCHVMARESFEDPEVARVLNERFVPVKVDREEHPDVDALYMEAVLAISGHGGWPMSVFLTPEGRPFFGGTYFPPEDRHGMPSFRRVLEAVDEAWRTRRTALEAEARALEEVLRRRLRGAPRPREPVVAPEVEPRRLDAVLDRAVAELEQRFDERHGGFGGAPKFPQPSLLRLLALAASVRADDRALRMLTATLEAMARGGIYDHLGGGFARYSTDATWTVPHFEKMLYDQAQLAVVYLEAWQLTNKPAFAAVARETLDWVLTDLRLDAGGYGSARDADSEGEEGRYYLWTPSELEEAVGGDAARLLAAHYGVTEEGNFEGRCVLRLDPGAPLWPRSLELEQARQALHAARRRREPPALDDKAVVEFNAMLLVALCRAARALDEPRYAASAEELSRFLEREARAGGALGIQGTTDCSGGPLAHGRWRRSVGSDAPATARDLAWIAEAFLSIAELDGDLRHLEAAKAAITELLERFLDAETGLLRLGDPTERKLIVDPLDLEDGATPSANAVALAALVRLAAACSDPELEATGHRLAEAARGVAVAQPLAHPALLAATWLEEVGALSVVVTGKRPDLLATVARRHEPTAVVLFGDHPEHPLFVGRTPGLAYVCRRGVCTLPAATPEELEARLDAERPGRCAGRSASTQDALDSARREGESD
jgi:uncharacterized protein YyaL (SSP411 family)